MSRASMHTSRRVLTRGSAVDASSRRELGDGAGERRIAVGEPTGIVAREAHVQAPVAEIEVGMVVGRLSRVGDLADEGDRVREGRGHEPGLDPLQQDAPVGQVVAAGELRSRVRAQPCCRPYPGDLSTTRARGRGPPAARSAPRPPDPRPSGSLVCPRLGSARGRRRRRCPRSNAPSGGRTRVGLDLEAQHARPPGRSTRPGAPAAPATPARCPAAAFGRRQNALKSCSPRNGSHARVSSSTSSGTETCQAVAAMNGSGHGPVQHGVAVGTSGGREASIEVGRGGADLAHDDRGTAQLHQRALQGRQVDRWPAGRATRPGPTRARRGRCARRT